MENEALRTTHRLEVGDARRMSAIADGSVHLVVTSPPYPMIEMWDEAFEAMAPGVAALLAAGRGFEAFEAMHVALDDVWAECRRVLVPGGIVCVNVGSATRSLADEFCLFPNHARLISAMMRLGFTPLPDILWRKPTNAPNKFMGSGMLPAGAYVTYEHEYILIFRRGGKRLFSEAERKRRAESAYFWEERNVWFSDLWTDLRGSAQRMGADGPRERSAVFPFELAYRLVNMYAVQGDVVLDPFAGTGTTMAAALAAGRSSVGYERVPALRPFVEAALWDAVVLGRDRATARLVAHAAYMREREAQGKAAKHRSRHHGFPVVTKQEVELHWCVPASLRREGGVVSVEHAYAEVEAGRPSGGAEAPSTAAPARSRRAGKRGGGVEPGAADVQSSQPRLFP
jgi:DNA modification methylase